MFQLHSCFSVCLSVLTSEASYSLVDQPAQAPGDQPVQAPNNQAPNPPTPVGGPTLIGDQQSDIVSERDELISKAPEQLFGSSFSNYKVAVHKWDYMSAWIIEVMLVSILMLKELSSNQIHSIMYFLTQLYSIFQFDYGSSGCLKYRGHGAHYGRASITQGELPVGTQEFNSRLVQEFKFIHQGAQRIEFPYCTDVRHNLMIDRIIDLHCLDKPLLNQSAVTALHLYHRHSDLKIRTSGGKHCGLPFSSSEVLTDCSYYQHTIKGKTGEKFQPLKEYMTACFDKHRNHSELFHAYTPEHIGVKVSLDNMDSLQISSAHVEDIFSYWKAIDS